MTTTTVSAGVTSSNLSITNGNSVDVLSAGTIDTATIFSGGFATIEIGGVDSGSTISQGGTEIVFGSATGDVVSGTQIVSSASAIATNETVASGGVIDVFTGGASASGITVNSGGTLNINGAATASSTDINGGTVVLESKSAGLGAGSLTFTASGGVLEFTSVTAQFSATVGPTITGFTAGDIIDEAAITSGVTLTTTTGGGNTTATMNSGTTSATFVFSGGIASNLLLGFDSAGGGEIFYANTVTSVPHGATSSSLNVATGNAVVVSSGGTLASATIQAGGSAIVLASATDSGTTIASGGGEVLSGSATKDQVSGTQYLVTSNASVTSETVFNGGAVELLVKGATATGVTVSSGGSLAINGAATASNTVINGGTVALESAKATLSGSLTFTGAGVLELGAVASPTSSGVSFGDQAVISGFTGGDVVTLTAFSAATKFTTATTASTTTVTVSGTSNGSAVTETLIFNGTTIGSQLQLVTSGGTVELICFARGTRISTPRGDVPVESLAVGDTVLTLGGAVEPIVWIGTGHAAIPPGRHDSARPVIVRKDALGDGIPCRDLRVTKGHSLFIDDVLIPVEFLVNHRSIVWDDAARAIEVFHIELPRHGVLIAEGAPAESYRDDGNRTLFGNANSGWSGAPQPPCAPVLTGGPVVDAAWRRLLDRAGSPSARKLTNDPDLHLLVDGRRVEGKRRTHGAHVFRVPPRATQVRIASRHAIPDRLGISRDPRALGVALSRILVWQGARLDVIEASDPSLREGFHAFEPRHGFRWTNGGASLPGTFLAGMERDCDLELRGACTSRYPLDDAAA